MHETNGMGFLSIVSVAAVAAPFCDGGRKEVAKTATATATRRRSATARRSANQGVNSGDKETSSSDLALLAQAWPRSTAARIGHTAGAAAPAGFGQMMIDDRRTRAASRAAPWPLSTASPPAAHRTAADQDATGRFRTLRD